MKNELFNLLSIWTKLFQAAKRQQIFNKINKMHNLHHPLHPTRAGVLTRAGVPCRELLHFYTAVIRPVLEYAAPVWHYAITQAQTQQLESVQKRAIHIIWYSTRGLSYHNALFAVNLPSLQARRKELSNLFFREICNPNSCLNYRLPPSATPRWPLDSEPPLLTPVQRTKKYCSFINYGFSHYQ